MGKDRFDQIIVVDIEATCWEPKEEQGDQLSEIIEIGVCRLNTRAPFKITDAASILVRPIFSEITAFCTELTGITKRQSKQGMRLSDACNKLFRKYGTSSKMWASWGSGDREHFLYECGYKRAKYPFGHSHLNVSSLFSVMSGIDKKVSVEHALEMLNKSFEGRPHSAKDDAYNTAVILRELLFGGKEDNVTRNSNR